MFRERNNGYPVDFVAADVDIIRLTGEIRAGNPALIDRKATDDQLGIFEMSRGLLRPCVTAFLGGTLDSILSLERGMIKNVGNVPDETASLPAANNESPELSRQKDGLISLTSFLSRVLYYSNDPSENDEILYMSNRGRKMPRYNLRSRVLIYLPDIPTKHGFEVYPPNKYNFTVPATITMYLTDNARRRLLLFTFFPLGYSFYKKHQELAGVVPSEGKEILNERARDLRRFELIDGLVNAAQKTHVVPGFKVSLIENGGVISCVQGDFSSPEERRNRPPGFIVYAQDFSYRTVFQPLAYQNGRREHMNNNEPNIYMRPVVEGFLNLKLKK